MRYASLWNSKISKRQIPNNVTFSFYVMNIDYNIKKTPRLIENIIAKYNNIARFKVGMHYIYIHPIRDPERQWLVTSFKLTNEEVDQIIGEWEEAWKVPIENLEVQT